MEYVVVLRQTPPTSLRSLRRKRVTILTDTIQEPLGIDVVFVVVIMIRVLTVIIIFVDQSNKQKIHVILQIIVETV